MAASKSERARSGCFRFFVLSLPVNDRCHLFDCVLANTLPNTHDIAAGGVDDLATAFLDFLQGDQIGPESRNDHDIICVQLVDLGLAPIAEQIFYPHGSDLLVNQRVMNDLAKDEYPASGKNLSCRIRKIDRPLNAVTKAKLFCQPYGRVTNG